jgi:ABC-type Fe3+ transport system substrate-binding protein
MRWRALLLIAIVAVVAWPFALRPSAPEASDAVDTVVVISPHNEAIRHEFARGFAAWYRARTGRTVRVDWRVVGGTTDISRFLEAAYTSAFERQWREREHRGWTDAVQSRFQSPRAENDVDAEVRAARAAFLVSNVSCGVDVFFGGDTYQYGKEASAGRLVDAGLLTLHPDWFSRDVIPGEYNGERFWDPQGRWYGVVLSGYGILSNRDAVAHRHVAHTPEQWIDLTDYALEGQVALADPTKSGSVCEAFENIIQQQMQRCVVRANDTDGVRQGWLTGLRLIQAMGANARYFTDSSQKPPIDVAAGDCAAGLCIDFYGRQQQEATIRRGDSDRIAFHLPEGGTAISADPIALLRGAPHRAAAVAFIEYTLSPEGQKLWAFRVGAPGGPEQYALRRMPIRRDFYAHAEWAAQRSDPADNPYSETARFIYHPEWTGDIFREIGFVCRVMCEDTHAELVGAWRAIHTAPEPQRTRALAVLQMLEPVAYDRVVTEIHRRLSARDGVEEVKLATELGDYFRRQYAEAKRIAESR